MPHPIKRLGKGKSVLLHPRFMNKIKKKKENVSSELKRKWASNVKTKKAVDFDRYLDLYLNNGVEMDDQNKEGKRSFDVCLGMW